MEDPDISTSVQQFNINLIKDVNNFMRQGTSALRELKSKIADEHEQKQKLLKQRRSAAAPNDVDLIFQSIEAFNKQKYDLKVDAETMLKQFSQSWESALERVLEVMLAKYIKKVDDASLAADDFKKSQISPYRNTYSGGSSWQSSMMTEDDDTDVIEEEHIIRTSPSPIDVMRQQIKRKRKSESISPDSEDSESTVEIEEPLPTPSPKKTRKSVSYVKVSVPIDCGSPKEISLPSPPSRRTRGRQSTPAMSKKKDAEVIPVSAQKRKSLAANKAITPSSSNSKSKSALWIPLSAISGTVSDLPSVYQLKVHQAKKPAFIGYCTNLDSILSKYQHGGSTGKKHLDKFIQRNLDSIEIQSAACSSIEEAKQQCEELLDEFARNFNNRCPVYNN